MKTSSTLNRAMLILALVAAGAAGSLRPAHAAALQGQLQIRPLTPQEVKTYGLTGVQTASGLSTVAIGQPAYFDLLVNSAVTNGEVVSVTWSLTNAPLGSVAVLTNSPLGTNVPPYRMIERTTTKVGGRIMIRPDVVGQYTIKVSVVTLGTGSTNLTKTITAGTYLGANTCALCHSGGVVAENTYTPWTSTAHAGAFTRAIDGQSTDHFTPNCIKCHAVGFDANTNSANGGFDDVAAQTGWQFPTTLTNGNWAAMPAALKNVSNVQCENCHGPGSQHAYSLGNTNLITVTTASGDCAQCHDSLSHHYKTTEWNNSRHAIATRSPSGAGRDACVRCHTADGFVQYLDFAGTTNVSYVTNTVYEPITCATCHDPHDATNPHQLRAVNTFTLPEGTTVTNAGLGAICMQCHHSRNGSASNNVAQYQLNQPTWAGGVSFGPHDSTAGDMVEGVNAITYGKFIPSSTHSYVVTNVCVGCHMQPLASTDPGFTKAGGHTFSMSYSVITNGVTNVVDKTEVCISCHGPSVEEFNFARKDYDGDGVIQGVQTEVQNLLDQLSRLLPNSTYRADGNYVADGLVKTIGRTSVKTNWQTKFLNGAWNHMFVNVEGSHGIHNASYAVGVLKASIADLTDDADNDGLSDKWEIASFGSINYYNGNGDPDKDGVNNALEASAGTNPNLADSDGDGVNDLAEMKAGSDPLNAADKPGFVVKIFTAAEIEFASEIGKRYQVQSVSDVTGTWLNVGSITNGTGNNINMVTSTKSGGSQAYFRVVQVP
jgi:Doubled CXXCH motif (Paired_CXXCH_1)/Bacterial TSP3 repeat/Cytochrome c554 and c-prime